ncbi:MAG: Gfo/Idh/MocA family oxidoreductase [Parafilimonas sp.]
MINWGILGCGRIARKFASDLKLVEDARLVAAGARSRESVEDFAKEFPVMYKHDSYEALAANAQVDVIYIATPHSHHYEHTLLCIEHGKAVLCEKAFAMNKKQAQQMIDAARTKNVFLMEAFWTKFLPPYNKVKEMINEGMIGEIKTVLVNFGFAPSASAPLRLLEPALGGGSLLDIGVYPVFLALNILGKPDEIEATMTPAPSGVDEQCAIAFQYNNGAIAQLFSSFACNLATEADIAGSKGRIKLSSRFHTPSAGIEFYPGATDNKQIISVPIENGFGYQYEARHVCDCLEKNLKESPVIIHADTLLLMEILDEIRSKAGIHYPVDEQ